MRTDPRVYLAIDNCFASKRWTAPGEWARVVRDLGVRYVEASADNECDPLYSTPARLAAWRREIAEATDATGVRVANLYSGHGTYATLGLAHTDERIREHIHYDWLEPMVRNAAALGAGLGFFCHAFDESTLQDPERYERARDDLVARLADLARLGRDCGAGALALEQMYTPHQVPWTLAGARDLLSRVWRSSGAPFYLTVDVGHAYGQRRFVRPGREEVERRLSEGRSPRGMWLGPRACYRLYEGAAGAAGRERASLVDRLCKELDRFPHLFGNDGDADPYAWLERFGCYSPIVHLQQTDGTSSPHRPFTEAENAHGIIHGDRVLRSLVRSCHRRHAPDLPPPCEEIYLTIEVFSGTADIPADLLADLEETVAYWRGFVPEDGRRLSELVSAAREPAPV